MTLAYMRVNNVRSLSVSYRLHQAVLAADPWRDHLPVP
jgi:hypothetical protein